MSKHVLMVCTGNICRSPIAAALLRQSIPEIEALSAGTHALIGRSADPLAMTVMRDRGIDLGAHVATALNDDLVNDASFVFAMTHEQRRSLQSAYPNAKDRIHLMCEREGTDVVDPYRRTRFTFELATSQIESGLSYWLDAIRTFSA